MRRDDIPWEWTFAPEPTAPPLTEALKSGPTGRAARRYHLTDRVFGGGKVALNALFGVLPPPAAASLGGRVAGTLSRRYYGEAPFVQRMKAHAAVLDPTLGDDEAREAFVRRWFASTGRTMSDFANLEAIATRHTQVTGREAMEAARHDGRPLVVVTVHTGTWELVSYFSSRHLFNRGSGAWAPQSNRFENRIVARTRRRLDIKALPATPQLAPRLYRVLKEPGQFIVLVVDEPSEGTVKFPLFGRSVPERCNFAFALRVAQRAGGIVLPVVIARTGPSTHAFAYRPAIEVRPGEEGLGQAAGALNGIYEPHVRAHLDQWYMLHKLRL